MQLSAISLAITRPQRSGTAAWSPASLFASSEEGAWYDPSDLTTMFQDRAGTTPVTADGQTVGLILDKSGRGNHATAPSDAARPLYKTSGGYSWLQFDGVDDSIWAAVLTTDFNSPPNGTMFHGLSRSSSANYMLLCQDDSTSNRLFGILQVASGAQANNLSPSTYRVDGVAVPGAPATTRGQLESALASPARHVSTATGLTLNTWSGLQLGGQPTFNGAASIYSFILLMREATAGEITDTETWVNGKTGAF